MEKLPVVPEFLKRVHEHTEGMIPEARLLMYAKIQKRLEEGMAEYGVPLTTNNGRDAVEDAWEEACDQVQYLVQAQMEGKLLQGEWFIKTAINLLQHLSELLVYIPSEVNNDGREAG